MKGDQNLRAPAARPLTRYLWAMKTKIIPGRAAIREPAHIWFQFTKMSPMASKQPTVTGCAEGVDVKTKA